MLKVLIVDDSLIIRRKSSELFEKLGHKVVGSAKNGEEAIELYKSLKPDFVTMDITMPNMDGVTALKEIIKDDENAKIVMVTSHGQESMVLSSIKAGAIGYILKPISEEKLAKVVSETFAEYEDEPKDSELDI